MYIRSIFGVKKDFWILSTPSMRQVRVIIRVKWFCLYCVSNVCILESWLNEQHTACLLVIEKLSFLSVLVIAIICAKRMSAATAWICLQFCICSKMRAKPGVLSNADENAKISSSVLRNSRTRSPMSLQSI